MLLRKMSTSSGYSLVEVLIALALLSVVFLGTTAVYVSSKKLVKKIEDGNPELDLLLIAEDFSRKAILGNDFQINLSGQDAGASFPDGAGNQIVIRRDYDQAGFPLQTPADTSDDTYLKYGFVSGGLHFKTDDIEEGFVTGSDSEVVIGLNLSQGYFQTSDGDPRQILFSATSNIEGKDYKISTEVTQAGRSAG